MLPTLWSLFSQSCFFFSALFISHCKYCLIVCLFVLTLFESSIATQNDVHIRYLRGRHVLAHSSAQLSVIGPVITAAGGTSELLTERNYKGAIAYKTNLFVPFNVVTALEWPPTNAHHTVLS